MNLRVRTKHATVIALQLLIVVSSTAPAAAEHPPADVTYFRSDNGRSSGIAAAPADLGITPRWRRELDSGHSTPCITDRLIILTTYDDETSRLATVAIDRSTGRILWQAEAPTTGIEEVHQVGSPAAASAACHGNRVFVFFGSCGLLCYDLDGQLLWSRSMGPFQDEYGSSSSPVLTDKLVVINEDHDTNNALYAFDQSTGEPMWKVPRDEFTRSYSTPVVTQINGETQILVAGALTLTAYDAASGERRWWVHGLARIVNPTPAVHGRMAYVASWSPGGDVGERIEMDDWQSAIEQFDANRDRQIRRNELTAGAVLSRFYRIDLDQDGGIDQAEWEKHADVFARAKNAVLAVQLGGHGDRTATNVQWDYSRGIPYVSSPLYDDGVVFLVKDGGILTTLDASSGKLIKQGRLKGRGNYYASPFLADGKVYLASQSGVVTVVSAAGEWEILSYRDFGESIYSTPAARDGDLYIRTSDALYCFSESG